MPYVMEEVTAACDTLNTFPLSAIPNGLAAVNVRKVAGAMAPIQHHIFTRGTCWEPCETLNHPMCKVTLELDIEAYNHFKVVVPNQHRLSRTQR